MEGFGGGGCKVLLQGRANRADRGLIRGRGYVRTGEGGAKGGETFETRISLLAVDSQITIWQLCELAGKPLATAIRNNIRISNNNNNKEPPHRKKRDYVKFPNRWGGSDHIQLLAVDLSSHFLHAEIILRC